MKQNISKSKLRILFSQKIDKNRLDMSTSDFDLNPQSPQMNSNPKKASVLIALQKTTIGWEIILTKRAAKLKHHPSQISLPGGKIEKTDENPKNAALREAYEEIGLHPDNVDIIAKMPCHQTSTYFNIIPFVGLIKAKFTPVLNINEVAEIFTVPLSYIINLKNYQKQTNVWNGKDRHYNVLAYGPHYIWGATARILQTFAQVVNSDEN